MTTIKTPTTVKADEFNAKAYIALKGSKSAAIRALLAEGKTRAEVSKLLGIRYQHVRNVEITPIKTQRAAKQQSGRVGTEADL